MQTTYQPPKRGKRRNPLIIVIAAVIAAAVILAGVYLFINSLNQDPFPLRSAAVPGAQERTMQTPQAMRYDLSAVQAAEAYFARLMDSKYIGLRGETGDAPQQDEGGWLIREYGSDGGELTASFDMQGLVYSLSVTTGPGGEMHSSKKPYRLDGGDESLFTFIRAFAYEYLPDVVIDSGVLTADEYNEQGRYLTVLADNQITKGAYRFIVQVDPQPRITGFDVLVDPSEAFIRSSRMAAAEDANSKPSGQDAEPVTTDVLDTNTAIQLARDVLAETYGFSEDETAAFILADISYYTPDTSGSYSAVDSTGYFVVSFRRPETDPAFFSDYAVFLDEATGEVLRILDPSNISNG